MGLRWCSRQGKRLSPLSLSLEFKDFTHHTHVTRVSQRSAESRVFSGHSGFLPQWKLGGLGQSVIEKRRQSWGVSWKICVYLYSFFGLLPPHCISILFIQIDAVGKPSWQAQIKGTKQWILEPPPECYFKCKKARHVVVVQPGDISKCL